MKAKRFKKVYIEITNICNLSCAFCPKTIRHTAFIEPARFEHIIQQIEPFTNHVYLHVKGEPLLHPQLAELIDIAANYQMRVHLVTNGTLIAKQASMLLSKSALFKLSFSLHSFEQNAFAEGDHASYVRDILMFTKQALLRGDIIVSLRLWNLRGTNTNSSLNSQNNIILQQIEETFKPEQPLDLQSLPGKGIRLAPQIYLNFDNEFVWPHLDDTFHSTTGFCHALRDQAAILVDGTVVPCCLDENAGINLGNIFEQNFDTIINSPRATALYNGFSEQTAVEALCQKCRYKERFAKV